MGQYNFQLRFVKKILRGEKTHTIRARRRYRAKVGETLHLYTGLRQKGARLLMRVPCIAVNEIKILPGFPELPGIPLRIVIDGEELAPSEVEALARRDGFETAKDMAMFWKKTHDMEHEPFTGDIIHWSCPSRDREGVVARKRLLTCAPRMKRK